MGKLADLAAVRTASTGSFVYTPPDAAFGAARILVKPAMGYPKPPPATVSLPVLQKVLTGLRRAAPHARIVVMEGTTSDLNALETFEALGVTEMIDHMDEVVLADAEDLLLAEYPNISPEPVKYEEMVAPQYIGEFDCVISVSAFKRTMLQDDPLISASLKNLYGVFPRERYHSRSQKSRGQLHHPGVPQVLRDVYFCVGHLFDGAVVDLTQKYSSPDWRPDRVRNIAADIGKVIWGDDLLAVDETACRLAGEPVPDYITAIRQLRKKRQADNS
jgi:hypothetical protein